MNRESPKNRFGFGLLVVQLLVHLGCGGVRASIPELESTARVYPGFNPTVTASQVVVVVLENTDYEDAIHQPFFSTLIQRGALLTNYQGLARPSQPNYIALVSGELSLFTDANITLDRRHLGDLLEENQKTWKNYAEGYPGDCFLGERRGAYVRKHVPFLSFRNIQSSPTRCAQVVDGDQFLRDLSRHELPDFSLYTPDMNNNAHDTSMAYADRWLARFFEPIFADPWILENVLFVVTFDEGAIRSPRGNHFATVFLGKGVIPGVRSDQLYTHYNLLRTLEEIFHVPTLGHQDMLSRIIGGIWTQ